MMNESAVCRTLVRRALLTLASITTMTLGFAQVSSSGPSQRTAQASVYLAESFDGGSLPEAWSIHQIVGTSATWTVIGVGTNPPVVPHSGSGQAKFNSYDASLGEQARLISPALDLSSSADPFAEFFMYHDDEFAASADSLVVELSIGDSIQGPWVTLLHVARPRATSGWLKEAVSLFSARGLSRVFLAFRGVSRYGNNIFLDDVRVLDSAFHDIRAVGFVGGMVNTASGVRSNELRRSVTEQSVVGTASSVTSPRTESVYLQSQELPIHVIVENVGTYSEPSYSLLWSVDGETQSPIGNYRLLGRSEKDTLLLPWSTSSPGWHEIAAWTLLPSDSNRANDTIRMGVQIMDSTVVAHEFFNGEQFPPPGWSVVNRDGGQEDAWFRGSGTSAFVPFEGAGFAADNFQRANGFYLDDYLISSPVPNMGAVGARDSLLFWVRSAYAEPPAASYPDSLVILLSLGGSDTSDFSVVLDYFEVPKGSWSRRAYGLTGAIPPNSTIRAAFRYLHFDAGTNGASADFVGIDGVHFKHVVVTSVDDNRMPDAFALYQNFPNPFNPATTIRYVIPGGTYNQTFLRVFDVLGRGVATLVHEQQSAGVYNVEWTGRNSAGTLVSSGVYIYRLDAGALSSTRKMLLIR